jgi:hypothetical protein
MHWEALECAGRTSEGGRYGGDDEWVADMRGERNGG